MGERGDAVRLLLRLGKRDGVFVQELAEQIVVGGAFDTHSTELAGERLHAGWAAREVHDAVDVRRLAGVTPDEHELAVFARAFYEDLELLTDQRFEPLFADFALHG